MRTGFDTLTGEERVRQIRAALNSGDRAAAERHFATLLQESRQSTERWLRRVIAMTPALHNPLAYAVSDNLRHVLALYLWERIATRHEVAWEHVCIGARSPTPSNMSRPLHDADGVLGEQAHTITPGRGVTVTADRGRRDERAEAPGVLSAAELAGDVRAVRTLLHQAREGLGPWYEGLPQEGAAAGARGL